MVRKTNECLVEHREHMRDGNGTVHIINFASKEELNSKGRLFSRITLNPGCSIGFHVHEGDTELYYILKGEADYNDNGTMCTVSAGDVTFCPNGTGHGIANNGDDVVEFIALIVYD